ncbi:hypothetical protein A2U01_0095294, partial [Trifolium medium]|nr:hypothetical protein [Trifolium medium]
ADVEYYYHRLSRLITFYGSQLVTMSAPALSQPSSSLTAI